jgi:GT2 family glycosyltransferase
MTTPALSVVIPSYQGREVLPDTLDAVVRHVPEPYEIIVVDDGSTDGGAEWLRSRWPDLRLILLGENSGGRVNGVRNRGIEAARAPLVLLLDDDVLVQPGCVETLRHTLLETGAVACTPRLLDRQNPQRIYADGGRLHYLGLSIVEGRGETVGSRPAGPPMPTFGGGIMLLDRIAVLELGGFDPALAFGWADDAELHLRARLHGRPVLHVSAATCWHLERSHGTRRAYAQLHNRWRVMAVVWQARTLVTLLPLLLVFESLLFVSALVGGFVPAWCRAVRDVFAARHELRARRRALQATRVVSDAAVMEGGAPALPLALRHSRGLRATVAIATAIADAFWRLAGGAASTVGTNEARAANGGDRR